MPAKKGYGHPTRRTGKKRSSSANSMSYNSKPGKKRGMKY